MKQVETQIFWEDIKTAIKKTVEKNEVFYKNCKNHVASIFKTKDLNYENIGSISHKDLLFSSASEHDEQIQKYYLLHLLEVEIDGFNKFNLLNFQIQGSYCHNDSKIEKNYLITSNEELEGFLNEYEFLTELNYISSNKETEKYWFANNIGKLFIFDEKSIDMKIGNAVNNIKVPNVKLISNLKITQK